MQNIVLAFTTGLTAGGISCFAVQGGLLTSSLAQSGISNKKISTTSFLVAKILAYTALGFLLGLFGSKLTISTSLQGWLQVFAGVYMLATAANLLQLHPIFRFVVIQPPKWAYKLLKKESQKQAFGPALLGALTVLIPCGITQGMMLLAVSTASPLLGAAILFAFTLGTSPVFFIIGMAASEFLKRKAFLYAATLVIILLGINSISTGNVLRGSPHTLGNYWKVLTNKAAIQNQVLAATDEQGAQSVTIEVNSGGYKALANTLKVNVPVRLKLVSKNAAGCVQIFTIPTYSIKQVIPQNGETEIAFTPTKTGRLTFSCAMGMYTGEFQVI